MKVAIVQPYCFPYISYFQLINSVDKFIVYDNLNFIKESWGNRNRILLKCSGTLLIHIPLKHKSSFRKYSETKIDNSGKWRDKLKKTLSFNYRKAPMFEDVFPLIEDSINYPADTISEFNFHSLQNICRYMNITTLLENKSDKYRYIEDLLLSKSYLDIYNNIEIKTARVIEICRIENADIFHNAIGGMKLYSKDIFLNWNIKLKFIKTNDIIYKQYQFNFIPDLSIIDVVMFNSKPELNKLLNEYTLI